MTKAIQLMVLAILVMAGIWLFPKAFPGATEMVTKVAGQAPIAKAVAVDCYVGYTGHKASITVTGITAGAVCDRIVSADKNLFRLTQPPTQSVICERDAQGFHFTIRDEGILKTIGNQLCKQLASY